MLFPFNCFTVILKEMHFSVRPGFHGERELDRFNMVISGMKTTFYTLYMNSKYIRITNRDIIFFTVILKNEYLLF